jgi:hypothetical protein
MLSSFMQAAYLQQLVCFYINLSLTLFGKFTLCPVLDGIAGIEYLSLNISD